MLALFINYLNVRLPSTGRIMQMVIYTRNLKHNRKLNHKFIYYMHS